MLSRSEQTALIHTHLEAAAACRRAVMTGCPYGFHGPKGLKASARNYIADVRQRRLMLAGA